MTDNYQKHIAAHYAAYRPPLHQIILESALPPSQIFKYGLDIGCGTGYSAVALANHCQQIVAIDPSPSMLAQAQPHPSVRYLEGSGEHLPENDQQFDLISFAGSLFYVDQEKCLQQLKRVTAINNTIVVYDFEILLDDHMDLLNISPAQPPSDYDHQCQFPASKQLQVNPLVKKEIQLRLTNAELTHIILSDENRYQSLVAQFSQDSLFESILNLLPSSNCQITANTYYTIYHFLH